jgi:RimJ/RimL family protein N-acetyltransferase
VRPHDPPGHHGDDPSDPFHVEEGAWHRELSLRDGSRVLLRQIRPDDRDRLAEGLRRLSPASRYLRFHRVIDHLTDEQLDELTIIDHVDHEAIIALDRDHPERPGVGVARYIREPYEPKVAEAAITVADEYQGQGAGTLLLGALAARARENEVRVFRNYVLDGNHAMLEVFDHLGATRELEATGLWRVDLPLPEDEHDLPDSAAGRAFLEAARGQRRLVSLFPPIWGHGRRRRRHDPEQTPGGSEEQVQDAEPDGDEEARELRAELENWLSHRERR